MVAQFFVRLSAFRLESRRVRYSFAVVAVAVAWASRDQLLPDAAERSQLVVFGLAILLTSLVAGLGPGVFATAVSALIAVLFYLPPYVALAVHAPFDLVLLTLFVVEGLVAAVAGGAVRAALQREDANPRSTARFAQFLNRAQAIRPAVGDDRSPLVEALTPRELEVARLLALGLSNDQIAAVMFVSVNTVKTHLKRIYGKVGVQTRTEAVARFIELDLLTAPPGGDSERFLSRARGIDTDSHSPKHSLK